MQKQNGRWGKCRNDAKWKGGQSIYTHSTRFEGYFGKYIGRYCSKKNIHGAKNVPYKGQFPGIASFFMDCPCHKNTANGGNHIAKARYKGKGFRQGIMQSEKDKENPDKSEHVQFNQVLK